MPRRGSDAQTVRLTVFIWFGYNLHTHHSAPATPGQGQEEDSRQVRPIPATVRHLRALAGLREGWNGYDALPPDRRAVTYAIAWIRELYRDAASIGRQWRRPHVTASADGEVVLEWWQGDKTLTVYLSADEATY